MPTKTDRDTLLLMLRCILSLLDGERPEDGQAAVGRCLVLHRASHDDIRVAKVLGFAIEVLVYVNSFQFNYQIMFQIRPNTVSKWFTSKNE